MSRRSWNGITEPDADGGDVYSSAVDESRLSYLAATARYGRSRFKARSTVLRCL